jgi:hypothetical protein
VVGRPECSCPCWVRFGSAFFAAYQFPVRLLHSDALDKSSRRPKWFHEIKHEATLIAQREGKIVRLWTRNGYD